MRLPNTRERGLRVKNVNLSAINIICNRLVDKKNHVCNFICLIVKQFIYKQRCLNKEVNFGALKGYIQQIERIEKYIATKNERLYIHNRKWGISVGEGSPPLEIGQYVLQYVNVM